MKIIVVENNEELGHESAKIVKGKIEEKSNAILGLATGSTPIGMYRELIQYHKEEGLDFSKVVTFNLDEYVGISPTHPQSYNRFMYEEFFNHININPSNVNIPRGDNPRIEDECKQYETKIRNSGGIDIQILGIGANGHIGFNEPGSDPDDTTRVVKLAESTIKANARFFGNEELVPRLAISMGIRTILDSSKQIILLASGDEKAEAVSKMVESEITSQVPATLLRLHSNVTIIIDKRAAKNLNKKQYVNA